MLKPHKSCRLEVIATYFMLLQLKQKKKLVFFLDSEFARTYPAIAKEDKNNDLAW